MKQVALIDTDGGQAALLPDEFRFEGHYVFAWRDPLTGDVVLSAKPGSWESYFDSDDPSGVPPDYMSNLDRGTEKGDGP